MVISIKKVIRKDKSAIGISCCMEILTGTEFQGTHGPRYFIQKSLKPWGSNDLPSRHQEGILRGDKGPKYAAWRCDDHSMFQSFGALRLIPFSMDVWNDFNLSIFDNHSIFYVESMTSLTSLSSFLCTLMLAPGVLR